MPENGREVDRYNIVNAGDVRMADTHGVNVHQDLVGPHVPDLNRLQAGPSTLFPDHEGLCAEIHICCRLEHMRQAKCKRENADR